MSKKHDVLDTIDYQNYCKRNIFIRQILPQISTQGFLLWELMIGLVIIMVAMITVYHWHAVTIKTYQQALRTREAILCALNERKNDKNAVALKAHDALGCNRTVHHYSMQSFKRVFQMPLIPDLEIACIRVHHQCADRESVKIVSLLNENIRSD